VERRIVMTAVNDAATTGGAESMTVDRAPSQESKMRSAIATVVRAVTRPAGINVDWQRVSAVGEVIGALAAVHGLKTRRWRYIHTVGAALGMASAAAGFLKDRFEEAAQTPDSKEE
jgi:hypothetical protein